MSHWRRGRSDRHLRRVMQQPASPSRDGALWLWAAIPIPMGHAFEADDRLSNSCHCRSPPVYRWPGTRGESERQSRTRAEIARWGCTVGAVGQHCVKTRVMWGFGSRAHPSCVRRRPVCTSDAMIRVPSGATK